MTEFTRTKSLSYIDSSIKYKGMRSSIGEKYLGYIKQGIWLYFLLIVFEGALRKWVFPTLAGPLLVIRDPVAIFILWYAFKLKLFQKNAYTSIVWGISIFSFCATLIWGHGNLLVDIFGARIFVLHFPLIFVIAYAFNREDVIQLGKLLLWISIPMTILMAMQFYSPQSAWVNRGVGGNMEGGGFDGAMGFFRPPTTFSFITGTSAFYNILACFIISFWLDSRIKINRILLLAASICLLIAIPLSISRTLLFGTILALLFSFVIVIRAPGDLIKVAIVGLVIWGLWLCLSNLNFMKTALAALNQRFENANASEGGVEGTLIDRFLKGLYKSIINDTDIPFFGLGLGMGTNAGSALLTGSISYLISEGEWGRLIGEQGPLLGLFMILIRCLLTIQLTFAGLSNLQNGNILPWVLLSFTMIHLTQGQWGQPTNLGFGIFVSGVTIAALKNKERETTYE